MLVKNTKDLNMKCRLKLRNCTKKKTIGIIWPLKIRAKWNILIIFIRSKRNLNSKIIKNFCTFNLRNKKKRLKQLKNRKGIYRRKRKDTPKNLKD